MEGKLNKAFEAEGGETPNKKLQVESGEVSLPDIMGQKRVYRNLVVVCMGFLCLFCAFQALGNLQSTLNDENNLGVISQSVIYATIILSSLFLPTLIIRKLSVKTALAICMAAYCPYIAANFYPHFGTMIPAAIILGLGAAPMWSAKCTYLNEIGSRFSQKTGEKVDTVIVRFFGIFFMFFQSSQIWGNLISWLVLDSPSSNETSSDYMCGANFDPDDGPNGTTIARPHTYKVNTLIGVYLGAGILGVILILSFLDPLKRDFGTPGNEERSIKSLLNATFKHMKKPNQIILIPLTMYSGFEQAFFLSDFSKAYVACAWGIQNIGFVAICFGVVNAVFSLSSGHMVKLMTRIPIFILATAANIGTCIYLLLWDLKPGQDFAILFVISGIWGFSDSIWQTQINAFYGVLFKGEEEPAFANYRLWESLGFVIAFAYGGFIGISAKITVVLVFLCLGIAGYLYIEFRGIPKR